MSVKIGKPDERIGKYPDPDDGWHGPILPL